MNKLSCICLVALAAGLLSTAPMFAQDAMSAPAQKTIGATKSQMVPSLAVLNSAGAKLENGKLTMSGITASSIVFADRPVRSAGHVLTSEFIKQWGEGTDSFAKDPPNATISVLSGRGDSVADAVVVLKAPKLEGGNLTFEVAVLEGDLVGADGPASLFIDWFAARGPYGGVAVGGRAPVWRGGWYAHPGAYYGAGVVAGAAIGAAAAERRYYAPGACGYYPYPPCY
ncbi:hypothetical protein IB265_19985 [Ensifer sp. ENS10]|uniref:hypothetical protein n=1 Tax=Ensifer sp. ENS10 TaxID=2769286 RepID=UPI00177AE1BE|nr:hypothetical protein [Ensifer sp. ENS10]MBD9509054.1 hypothetical protein [Ensifer sp. ENS10]